MKIAIVIQSEPFYLISPLTKIVKRRHNDIVGIIMLPAMAADRSIAHMAYYYLTFFGLGAFLYMAARIIKNKILDFMSRIYRADTFYSPDVLARCFNIPVYRTSDINARASLDKLNSLAPDLILSMSATQKFSKNVLNIPKSGCINVHSGPLPKYRGILPNFWVLLNGEKKTAVTVHYMDEEIDGGDIILQQEIDIDKDDTLDSLIKKTKAMGAELLLEALSQIESDKMSLKPNDKAQATYFSMPAKEDALLFKKRGKRFI